jgi:hypothetical protein
MIEREIHCNNMQQAWDDYCDYLGYVPHVDFAFSKNSKREIRERDGNECQNHDDCPFEETYTEVAHWVQGSDDPKDGRVSCRPSHFIDHAMGARMPENEKVWTRLYYPDYALD